MARDGSGNYSLPSGNPVVTNTIISSSGWANPTLNDIAAALTQSLSRDGQTTPTADLTMGNFKLRSLANAIARTDAVNAGQIQDGGLVTLGSVSGTDTITASSAPAITAYTAGQRFQFIAAGANTTNAVTLNINGLGAKNITKSVNAALAAGDIQSGAMISVVYDGTQFQMAALPVGLRINTQVFTASGTYTPTPGMRYAYVRYQGGGGAGSGSGSAGAGNASLGAPGANGTYAEGIVTAAQVGASKAVTIGAGGTGVSAGAGNAGGSTSLGSLLIAPGGPGGGAPITNVAVPAVVGNGSQSSAATGSSLSSIGQAQEFSSAFSATIAIGGPGGPSVFGTGARSVGINANGNPGVAYGSGGSGTVVNQGGGVAVGGAGAAGIMIIEEYA